VWSGCLGRDEVDRPSDSALTIDVNLLKKVIGRLETPDNPCNLFPVFLRERTEREKLYNILTNTADQEGLINYAEFEQLVQNAEDDPEVEQLVEYLGIIENGKIVVKWPPPIFIPLLTLLQLAVFIAMHVMDDSGLRLKETLGFYT
jgi:hypothetical protein